MKTPAERLHASGRPKILTGGTSGNMLKFQATLAARYLWGRKLRTFLTTLAIVFGTLVIFGTNMMMPTMMKAFQSNMMAASGQVDVTITQRSSEAFSRKVINELKTIPAIGVIAGSLSRTINIPNAYYGRAKISALTLTGIDPASATKMRNYPVKEGRFLHPGDTNSAVITTSLAETLQLKLGDKLSLPTTEGDINLKLVGLLAARAQPGNEEVLVSLSEAQKLLDLSDRINTIEINFNTSDETQRQIAQDAIKTMMGEDYTLGGLSSGSDLIASIQTAQVSFNLIGFLAMFMGGFIIFNTFRTIVAERRHDIGMLRAIGASRSTIIGMILTEGLLQGIIGTLIGLIFGYLMGAALLMMMSQLLVQYMNLELGTPVVEPQLVVITVLVGVGVTLLAGLLPAWNASRVTPLEALRPPTESVQPVKTRGFMVGVILIILAIAALASGNSRFSALGGLFFLVGLVFVAPVLVRPMTAFFGALITRVVPQEGIGNLAQGNLNRQPTRAAITASATMIGLAIIVGVGGMMWSITGGFLAILEKSLGSDYLIMPPSVGLWGSNVGAKQDMGDRLRSVTEVDVVSTMRFAAATANNQAVSLLGIDPIAYPKVASLNFQEGDAATAFAGLNSERTLIANGVFAAKANLKIGDTVQVTTSGARQTYRIVGVAGDYLNAKIMTAYISQANLKTDFRKDEDILFQIKLEPGVELAHVEPKLKKIVADYPQFKLISGKSYLEENIQIFNAVIIIYFILLGALAIPSLIALLNTLSIGIIERTREIGMLRAIGAARKQIQRMVLIEALLLAAIGTAFGLLAGLYLGYVMVLGLSVTGYPVTYVLPYQGLLAAIVTGLVFGVLAALLPAHQAVQMEIVRALRYE